jgi:predicted chitinase
MTNLQTKTRDALLAKGFSKKATANIMANIHAECNWKISAENMNYSGARLFALWGVGNRAGNKVRFHTRAEADALAARGPVAIGDVLYGNRMGNDANEGYKFRGRGLIQITGKENYSRYGKILGLDLNKKLFPALTSSKKLGFFNLYSSNSSRSFNSASSALSLWIFLILAISACIVFVSS